MNECPHCHHERTGHVELCPAGALDSHPDLLACTDHYVDPVTGHETFCDCVWDTACDDGARREGRVTA